MLLFPGKQSLRSPSQLSPEARLNQNQRSQARINLLDPINRGVIFRSTFDSNSITGTTVLDISGQHNNGSIIGTLARAPGRVGGAYTFNGSNTMIDTGGSYTTPVMTFAFWLKETTRTANATIFSSQTSGFLPHNELFSNNGVLSYVNGGGSIVSIGYTLPLNTWVHIVYAMSSANLTIYIAGASFFTATDLDVANKVLPMTIGGWYDTAARQLWFTGQIDEPIIWNRVLTASEARRVASDTTGNLGLILPQRRIVGVTAGSSANLTGVAATGSAGSLSDIVAPGFSGAAGTGSAGTVGGTDLVGPIGVAGTGGVGILGLSESKGVLGVSGTGGAGVLALQAAFTLAGATGTGGAGSLAAAALLGLAGAFGTGAAGLLGAALGPSLAGAGATGQPGSFAIAETFGLAGISGIGGAGLVGIPSQLQGAGGIGGAGFVSIGASTLGVGAIGGAGLLGTLHANLLSGASAVGYAGIVFVIVPSTLAPGRTLLLFADTRAVMLSPDIRALVLPIDEAEMEQPILEWSPAAGRDADFYWLLLSMQLAPDDVPINPSVVIVPIAGDANPLTVVANSVQIDTGFRDVVIPPGVPYNDPGPRIEAKLTGGTRGNIYVTQISWTTTEGRTINREALLPIQWA